jgi:hypothetical protein
MQPSLAAADFDARVRSEAQSASLARPGEARRRHWPCLALPISARAAIETATVSEQQAPTAKEHVQPMAFAYATLSINAARTPSTSIEASRVCFLCVRARSARISVDCCCKLTFSGERRRVRDSLDV